MQTDMPKELEQELSKLPEQDADLDSIEKTAAILEGCPYFPLTFMDNNAFFRYVRKDVVEKAEQLWRQTAEHVHDASDEGRADVCKIQIRTLINEYCKLHLLRRNDPDAWEDFNEVSLED